MKKGDMVKVTDHEKYELFPHEIYQLGSEYSQGWWIIQNKMGGTVVVPDHAITVVARNEPNPAYQKQNGVVDGVDNVNHPPHYTHGGIECIDAIKAQLTEEEYRGYLKGNVVKYVWREKHKGGTESLKKAQWYLNALVKFDEGTS